jgi:hypothetical protein
LLGRADQPDHREGEFDWLIDAAVKKMKALLVDERSQVKLGCGSSSNNGGGSAEPAGK